MSGKRKVVVWIGGAIAVLLIVLYLILPQIVLSRLNRKLANLDLYQGHVDAVSLRLFHAGLGLKELTLIVRGSKAPVPLIAVEEIDLHYSWKALIHGGFVGTADLIRPVVHYVMPPKGAPEAGPQAPPRQTKEAAKASAQKAQEQGYAYVSHAHVRDGRIEIQSDEVKPGYTIYLRDVRADAYNIGGKPGLPQERSSATAEGVVQDSGTFKGNLIADAMAEKPTFEYTLTMRNVALPQFNDWLRHYLFIEARDGYLEFDSEAKCVNGRIDGYVKPLIRQLDSVGVKGGKNVGKQIKGEVEKLAVKALRNPKKDQVGTQVSFSGDVSGPKTKVFPALVELVRNAFVKALEPGLRGIVDFGNFPQGKKG